ncbi:hypothetical protein, partial [Levilactobacillus spicheri]
HLQYLCCYKEDNASVSPQLIGITNYTTERNGYMYEVYLLVGFLAFWLTVIVLIASAGYQLRKSVVRAGGWAPFWKDFFGIEESK